MNIIEAVKSGRRMRQRSKQIWLEPKDFRYFSTEHILANDWEVEEPSVPLNRTQIERAYLDALKETKVEDTYRLGEVVECMIKKLGL